MHVRQSGVIIGILCLLIAGCGANAPKPAYERLVGPIPDGAQITRYWSSGLGIDHVYLWQLRFDRLADYNAAIGALSAIDTDLIWVRYAAASHPTQPHWWNEGKLGELMGRQRQHDNVFISWFFDPIVPVIYVQWMDT